MATQTVTAPASVLQFQKSIPHTFIEALKQGWRIIEESSRQSHGKRCGIATLEKDGLRVSVSYMADAHGYRFGEPKTLA